MGNRGRRRVFLAAPAYSKAPHIRLRWNGEVAMSLPLRVLLLAALIAITGISIGADATIESVNHVRYVAVPGAAETIANGAKTPGQIVGFYRGTVDPRAVGFILSRGQYTNFVFPGAAETDVEGLNDHGQIVGAYVHRLLIGARRQQLADISMRDGIEGFGDLR